MARESFGIYFKEQRINSRQTLRALCAKHGFDPGNLSRLERGLLPPPGSETKLTEYARALGIKRGSDEWLEFFDRAAAERGRVPADILSDDALVAKLPMLFRTLRGDKIDESKLDSLAEKIRRA